MSVKTTSADVETRITKASGKAEADGYERSQLYWYVTHESVMEFQRCDTYMERFIADIANPRWGMIVGIWVVTDPNLKGKIAELRSSDGQYIITLDFAAIVENDYAQLAAWRQERG